MSAFMERITVFCFAASYGVALVLELWHLLAPRPVLRLVGIGFGAAGLLAHTLYVLVQPLPLATPLGSLLFLAWILAIFYFCGTLHHRRTAWGLFVLPLVLSLVVLAVVVPPPQESSASFWKDISWGTLHGILVLLAAVGICVGFLSS